MIQETKKLLEEYEKYNKYIAYCINRAGKKTYNVERYNETCIEKIKCKAKLLQLKKDKIEMLKEIEEDIKYSNDLKYHTLSDYTKVKVRKMLKLKQAKKKELEEEIKLLNEAGI